MKLGSTLQFECPDNCPKECSLKPEFFYQGCFCTRCPVLNCKEPITEEDKDYMPLIRNSQYRDDWAKEWVKFFRTGEKPKLKLKRRKK